MLAASAVWFLASACSHQAAPRPLTITHTSPDLGEGHAPLLLNDAITVYFSDPVLPVSLTTDSVTMVDEFGQQVPGQLRVGGNWVTFLPEPPLSPELDDGSFRPGATYQLMIAGFPRSDAVRSLDDRRLAAARSFEVRIARLEEKPPGWPAPLRPTTSDLPFLLRGTDLPAQPLPADAPRLQLHFTQPLLPSSVVPEAFTVTLLATPKPVELVPRRVRVVTSRLDDQPGCTVDIDLGALPRRADDRTATPLKEDEWLSVSLAAGAVSVTDYAGNPPLPAPPLSWVVIPGSRLPLLEWPAGDALLLSDDDLMPGFEARGEGLRPAVRVEAGNGSLGVFRPKVDTILRPGQPFDRGDGEVVVSRGGEFPFQAIDIPRGVVVRVEAGETPVQLLACGAARIAGSLLLASVPQPLPTRRVSQAVHELVAAAPVTLLAAGGIDVTGSIRALTPAGDATTNLLLASPNRIHLHGELPFHTLLACESATEGAGAAGIRGIRGQSVVCPAVQFTYGLAAGADFVVRGLLPWRVMPLDRDGGVLHFGDQSPDLQVAWQSAPADAARKNEPDLGIGRVGRLQPANDGDTIAVAPGAWVRFALTAPVRSGRPLPRMRELRLYDR